MLGWRESQGNPCCHGDLMMKMMMMVIELFCTTIKRCRSILCLHPVNILSLWCFCRELLLLLRFLLVGRMLVGFVPSSPSPYLFIICLDYGLRTSIDKIRENGFELTKKRSRRYPAKTITDADYADDIALLANTPNQAETLLHSLERAAAGISLHVTQNWIYVL